MPLAIVSNNTDLTITLPVGVQVEGVIDPTKYEVRPVSSDAFPVSILSVSPTTSVVKTGSNAQITGPRTIILPGSPLTSGNVGDYLFLTSPLNPVRYAKVLELLSPNEIRVDALLNTTDPLGVSGNVPYSLVSEVQGLAMKITKPTSGRTYAFKAALRTPENEPVDISGTFIAVAPKPTVISAQGLTDGQIIVTFSEPVLNEQALLEPRSYIVTGAGSTITVRNVRTISATQVVLETLGMISGGSFTVDVDDFVYKRAVIFDALAVADSAIFTRERMLTLSDSMGLDDTLFLGGLATPFDTMLADDAVILGGVISPSDAISTADFVSASMVYEELPSDTISTTDSTLVGYVIDRFGSDSSTTTDVVLLETSYGRSLNDSLATTEALVQPDPILSDEMLATDSIRNSIGFGVAASDTATVADSVLVQRDRSVTLSDSAAITDLKVIDSIVLSESILCVDSVSASLGYSADVADTLSLTDSAVVVKTTEIPVTVSDSIAISDSVSLSGGAITDAVSITDSVSRTNERSPSDSLAVSDSTTRAFEWTRSDSVSVTDDITIEVSLDPAVLSLSGWYRASFTGSPWTPTASAGTSGANGDFAEATNPPATGTAINGLTPASFDGTNDLLSNATTVGTFFSASAWSMIVLFKAASSQAFGTDEYDNESIISSVGGAAAEIGMAFSNDGISVWHLSGAAWPGVTVAVGTGAWHLAQAKYDGTDIKLRIDGGAWSSVTAGNMDSTAETLQFGVNWNGAMFYDGDVAEVMLAASALADSYFDSILRGYINPRYNLNLT